MNFKCSPQLMMAVMQFQRVDNLDQKIKAALRRAARERRVGAYQALTWKAREVNRLWLQLSDEMQRQAAIEEEWQASWSDA